MPVRRLKRCRAGGSTRTRLEASANRLEAQLKLLQANRAAFPADSGDLEAALAKYGQAVTGWRHAIELWDAKRNSTNASWPGFDLSTAYGEAFYRRLESYAGERIAEALNPDKKYLDFDRAVQDSARRLRRPLAGPGRPGLLRSSRRKV